MSVRHKSYVDKFKKLSKELQYKTVDMRGITKCWEPPPQYYFRSPKSLFELALDVLDKLPLPDCVAWDTSDVVHWIENIVGLPQYRKCFEDNYFKGRELILIEPGHLVKMNIQNFEHILKILAEIRKLFGVIKPKIARDLTKPHSNGIELDLTTQYYRYIARQSPGKATSRSVYWRKAKLIKELDVERCHWYNSINPELHMPNKDFIARVRTDRRRLRYYVPMKWEKNYIPTTIKVSYLDGDPRIW